MVNEVNKLIFNALVDGYALYIPNLGTISLERSAALKGRANRVEAPSFRPLFSTESKGESLSNIIASSASISGDEAEDITRRWLAKVSTDGRVVIDGVGEIKNGTFTPSEQLTKYLKLTNKPIELPKVKKGSRLPVIILVVLLICALAVGGYLLYIYETNPTSIDTTNISATAESEASTTANESQVVMPAETSADTEVETNAETQEQSSAAKETVEQDDDSNNEQSSTNPEDKMGDQESQTVADDWRLGSVRHYVIFGSYSTRHNANVAIRQITRKNPAAQCKILTLGKMYAIAVYGSYNRRDCEVFKRTYRTLYKNAWIHTPKRFR